MIRPPAALQTPCGARRQSAALQDFHNAVHRRPGSSPHAPRRDLPAVKAKAGFVLLVEIVLALFVISMGVLAGVALITTSMDRGREARADTQLAMFGDGILEWLRASATEAGTTNGWAGFWADVQDGEIGIPVPAQEMWTPSNCVVTADEVKTVVLTNFGHHALAVRGEEADTGIPALVLRCLLEVDPDVAWGGRTNWCAQLKLWEGQFGSTNAVQARSLYTEFPEPGVLR
jgi:hypothetical protein